MEPTDCPEISVRNYHSSLHKISKVLRSYLHRGKREKSRIIRCMLTGAIWVDNCPQTYRRSNCRGRWSWWPQQCQTRISKNYHSNQEQVWLCLLWIFVTVFTKAYNSSLTWSTSISSITSHSTSSRSTAIYLPI